MIYQTILGPIEIREENGKITQLHYLTQEELTSNTALKDYVTHKQSNLKAMQNDETPLTKETYTQLTEYLEGKRKEFTIPIELKGTPFQMKVWAELQKIPYGETRSYQDIAKAIGSPKACRAVGMANHNNPIAIIIPCHRVIGKNNKLVGYAGGLDIKQALLSIEKENKKH